MGLKANLEALSRLQPNDSVFIARCVSGLPEYNAVMNKKSYLQRSKGWRFVSKSATKEGVEGLRVWRVS